MGEVTKWNGEIIEIRGEAEGDYTPVCVLSWGTDEWVLTKDIYTEEED